MKLFISISICCLFFLKGKAQNDSIYIQIEFENLTSKTFTTGIFKIIETNKQIEIDQLTSIKIGVPNKGKYHFEFESDGFYSLITHPQRISAKKNLIEIQLWSPIINSSYLDSTTSVVQIEKRIQENDLSYIQPNISDILSKEQIDFHSKYGVGFQNKNCSMDALLIQNIQAHNQRIADYLALKYHNQWKSDLTFSVFGLKE